MLLIAFRPTEKPYTKVFKTKWNYVFTLLRNASVIPMHPCSVYQLNLQWIYDRCFFLQGNRIWSKSSFVTHFIAWSPSVSLTSTFQHYYFSRHLAITPLTPPPPVPSWSSCTNRLVSGIPAANVMSNYDCCKSEKNINAQKLSHTPTTRVIAFTSIFLCFCYEEPMSSKLGK